MKKWISLSLLLTVALLTPAFEAAAQTPERRVGVQTSNRKSLTLREAVMMALENNRDIEIERLNARMNEFDLRAAKGVYDPSLTASVVETIQRAENALKSLMVAPGDAEMWSAALAPVEKPELDSSALMPLDDALKIAFKNRPEMEQYRLRGELNNIDVDYFRNQTKPRIDLIASYVTFGLAGKERRDLNPISASQEQLFARVNQLSQIAGLPVLPPFPAGATPEKFIGGYGQSLGNLFRNDYRAWRVGVNIELSIGARTAKAHLGRALVEGKQIDAQRQLAEQMIEVEVRNALQAVETARRRVEAAKNSRVNAELQHSSERRKFDAGQSTNFFVLDRQNALSAARGRELKALTDYNKSVSELQRALSTTLANNNVAVAGPRQYFHVLVRDAQEQ
jgi:HAE1 family hydrophobic/amphiphilic exporter-1